MDLLLYLNADDKVSVILLLLILLWTTFGMTKSEQADKHQMDIMDKDNSSVVTKGPFVAQVSLRQRRKHLQRYGAGHICGGTLIRRDVVLTAAHCFLDRAKYDGSFLPKSEFSVVVGIRERFNRDAGAVTFELRQLMMQLDKFDLHSYDKDIALIILRDTVATNIRPIQLANASVAATVSHCEIGGWNSTDIEYFSGQLHSYNVTVLDVATCRRRGHNPGGNHLLPGMLCARPAHESKLEPCTADSGGPLICAGQLVGIGSWGIVCGMPQQVGVYTDVAHHRKWIADSIQRHDSAIKLDASEWQRHEEVDFDQIEETGKSSGSILNHIYSEISIIPILSLCHL